MPQTTGKRCHRVVRFSCFQISLLGPVLSCGRAGPSHLWLLGNALSVSAKVALDVVGQSAQERCGLAHVLGVPLPAADRDVWRRPDPVPTDQVIEAGLWNAQKPSHLACGSWELHGLVLLVGPDDHRRGLHWRGRFAARRGRDVRKRPQVSGVGRRGRGDYPPRLARLLWRVRPRAGFLAVCMPCSLAMTSRWCL